MTSAHKIRHHRHQVRVPVDITVVNNVADVTQRRTWCDGRWARARTLPPKVVVNAAPSRVSPTPGIRGTRHDRSLLALPTTTTSNLPPRARTGARRVTARHGVRGDVPRGAGARAPRLRAVRHCARRCARRHAAWVARTRPSPRGGPCGGCAAGAAKSLNKSKRPGRRPVHGPPWWAVVWRGMCPGPKGNARTRQGR